MLVALMITIKLYSNSAVWLHFVALMTFDDLDVVVFGDKLNVERSSNIQSITNLACGLFDPFDGGKLQVLWWQDKGSVTRMDSGILDMLGNEVANHLSIFCDGIHGTKINEP